MSYSAMFKKSCNAVNVTIQTLRAKSNNLNQPKIKITLDGVTMVHDLSDFFSDKNGQCVIDFPVVLLNNSGPWGHPNKDIITIGPNYFKKFQGLHYNYDTKKLAFVGG